jgi:small GTP-binding protein
LVRQYVKRAFNGRYLQTIGTDVTKHAERFSLGRRELEVQLSIWDIMGNRKVMDHMWEAYFNGSRGALAVFDVTRSQTLKALPTWVATARRADGRSPMILLGNKVDIAEGREVSDQEAKDVASALEIPYLPTSAKTGLNVGWAFKWLSAEALRIFTSLEVKVPDRERPPGLSLAGVASSQW